MNVFSLNQFDFALLFDLTEEPLLVLRVDGVVETCSQILQRQLPIGPGVSLPDATQNGEEVRRFLHKAVQMRQSQVLNSLTFVEGSGREEMRLRVIPLGTGDNDEIRLLASLRRQTSDLEDLEEAARSTDERVERLSMELISVSRQLLEKTIQLSDQKNKLSIIVNGMAEGLIGCDEQGRIIHYNENACSLLSLPPGDLTHKLFYEVSSELSAAIRMDPNHPAEVGKQIVDVNLPEKDLRVSISPIVDEDGKAAGFVTILQDRSQQAELDRMKADLISIVSHELRSPLTSIKGYVDLLMAGDLGEIPAFMKSYLSIVSTNANRLAMLIDDMLDLSRIETGKLNMTFGRVDVKYLCDFVYLTLKPQAEQKPIIFQQKVQPGLAVSGDVDRLQQALTNLVSNAIKYTPARGSVTIQAELSDGRVQISVIDTGFGITAEDQKKLFQKFFRVKTEQTRNIGGTGLGLCIAKSIVEAHEGEIRVESRPGQGSTFSMRLPLYLS